MLNKQLGLKFLLSAILIQIIPNQTYIGKYSFLGAISRGKQFMLFLA
jgi:hypothetical protein